MPRPRRSKCGRPPKVVQQEWVVEEIRAKRYNQGVVEYFVKWQGFPETDNTWEPADNLAKCDAIVEAYEEALSKSAHGDGTNGTASYSPLPVVEPAGDNGYHVDKDEAEINDVETKKWQKKPAVVPRDNDRRSARAFHNYRYDEKVGDFYYMIEWADAEECEEISGSVAREQYPLLLLQFLSQNYSRTCRKSFNNSSGSRSRFSH